MAAAVKWWLLYKDFNEGFIPKKYFFSVGQKSFSTFGRNINPKQVKWRRVDTKVKVTVNMHPPINQIKVHSLLLPCKIYQTVSQRCQSSFQPTQKYISVFGRNPFNFWQKCQAGVKVEMQPSINWLSVSLYLWHQIFPKISMKLSRFQEEMYLNFWEQSVARCCSGNFYEALFPPRNIFQFFGETLSKFGQKSCQSFGRNLLNVLGEILLKFWQKCAQLAVQ